MRYAKSFVATFAVAFAFAVSANSFQTSDVPDPATSSIVYDDGTVVTVSRPGYPDVV